MKATRLHQTNLEYLFGELRRITALVAGRVQEIRAAQSEEEDEFRGLYISDEEVNELLADPYLFVAGDDRAREFSERPEAGLRASRLLHLQEVFQLSPFELDIILITLAPELEVRFERLYAYLQDDVTRRRPNVALVLQLLCPNLSSQVAVRRSFDPESPLLRHRLIEMGEESQNRQTPLLTRTLKLDESVVSFLLGEERIDARLRQLIEPVPAEAGYLPTTEAFQYTARLVELAAESYICLLSGAADEASKRHFAAEVCQRLGRPLLALEAAALPGMAVAKLDNLLRLLSRELRLRGAAFYLASYEVLLKEEPAILEIKRLVDDLLRELDGPSFVSTAETLPLALSGPRRQFQLELGLPGYSERQHLWESLLGAEALGLDLESLSSRFRLSSGQIVAAAATARNRAAWRGEPAPSLADLEAACRSHSNQRLNALARKITPCYRWGDLVLPADPFNMLREICEQVKHRSLVYEKWGFESKLSLGKGLNVIFAGPSGTGKTMSAEIIASELKMDLYKIDLSNVISKYIGETEKNLERIFTEAGESNAILFFDEADAIFGKRSEVKDAHDRYANIETGYLLQKMEEYEGIVILATNLRKNLDDAFVRRMHFVIEYPFPEEEDRFLIWKKVFPAAVPLNEDVDLRFMARQFKLAGGNIKNIALAAAFLAAGEDALTNQPEVKMEHLIRATRREFQKMGKLCTPTDFGPYFGLLKDAEPKRNGAALS
jgi:SpoVK/Ycf46/Vps4 family AAA+-type ATPase